MAVQPQGKHTILIVEDENSLRGLLADTMKQNGFIPSESVDGEEGLKKALEEHPDLILLDILMPKLDGITVLKKLREDSWGATVPVVILTNVDPDVEQLKAIEEYKASFFFVKAQTNMDTIVIKIQELLTYGSANTVR